MKFCMLFLIICCQCTSAMESSPSRKRSPDHLPIISRSKPYHLKAALPDLEVPNAASAVEMLRGMQARHLQYPLLRRMLWAATIYTVLHEDELKRSVRSKSETPLQYCPSYSEVMSEGRMRISNFIEEEVPGNVAQFVEEYVAHLQIDFRESLPFADLTNKWASLHMGDIEQNKANMERMQKLMGTIQHFCALTHPAFEASETEFLEKPVQQLMELRLKKSYPHIGSN